MIQPFGKGGHLGAGRGCRLGTLGPADSGRDVDRGNQGFVGLRQLGRRPGAIFDPEVRGFSAGDQACGEGDDSDEAGLGHAALPLNAPVNA